MEKRVYRLRATLAELERQAALILQPGCRRLAISRPQRARLLALLGPHAILRLMQFRDLAIQLGILLSTPELGGSR
jgi:hypothetical protein